MATGDTVEPQSTTALTPDDANPTALGRWQRFSGYSAGRLPLPPSTALLERWLYGLAQPLLGLRVLLADRQLFRDALMPAILLGGFCALEAFFGTDSLREFPRRFYRDFVLLAPVPSILFANHYARLAAFAHRSLGFGACDMRRETLWRSFKHAVMQTAVVAVAVAPLIWLLTVLPLFGKALAAVAGGMWALHWVVVEAFDSARVVHLQPPHAGFALTEIWFVRVSHGLSERVPYVGIAVRPFTRTCRYLADPWREEIVLTERHKALVFGFALSTATLLALPILNLLFRPIIIVASVHLLNRLREAGEGVAG